MSTTSKTPPHQDLAQFFRTDLQLDSVRTIDTLPADTGPGRRARFRDAGRREPMAEEIATLLWDGNCFHWDFGREIAPATTFSTSARRAWWWNKPAPTPPPKGEVVQQLVFEQLEKAQIGAALTDLDRRLTPEAFKDSSAPGVRRWEDGEFKPFDPDNPGKSKRILLFIHGTFSDSESLLTNGLMKSEAGKTLLANAQGTYDLILSFDHPTLSVSPALNAMDLAHVLRPLAPSHLDIVCHSRGGLVARWFCEVFCPADVQRRVVLVASPIAGTSLAAAPRVRDFFDFLTNAGNALRKAADLASFAAPWLAAVAGLMRLGTALTGGLARLPIADGLIALVPGLQGQARIGNNEEIARLQRGVAGWHSPQAKLRYFAITADFQPADPGWNFLAYFRHAGALALNAAADRLFPYANDLVVDTDAMTDLNGKLDAQRVQVQPADRLEFDKLSGVHHCNYFTNPQSVAAIGTWLKIP